MVAPAPGTVVGWRDRHPDGELAASGKEAVRDQECGNGVQLDLGGGWRVQLCHLHRGSVVVELGATVAAGERLGRVGWSGLADHPHVHLSVWRDDRRVDPFDGQFLDDGTAAAPGPLCDHPIPPPSAIDALVWAGFDVGPGAHYRALWPLDAGRAVIPPEASTLVLGVFLWRPEAGDQITTEVTSPDGETTRGTRVESASAPRRIRWIDKTWRPEARPTGLWTARVEWRRGDRSRVIHTSTVVT